MPDTGIGAALSAAALPRHGTATLHPRPGVSLLKRFAVAVTAIEPLNRFFGLHLGAWPVGAQTTIYARGAKARMNRIYGLDGIDNVPAIVRESGAELYWDYQGGGYSGTLAGEAALDRVPKQLVAEY